MRPILAGAPVDCAGFDRVCHAWLDDELAPGDREAIEAHLAACPACARLAESESAFDGALRARLAREPVPEGLEAKVRARLASGVTGMGPSAPRWRRFLGVSVLAASILFALALVPVLLRRAPQAAAGRGEVVHVRREATVVDLVCDRHGVPYALQRSCRAPDHVNALRLPDGTYWGILPSESAAQETVSSPAERGHRVTVVGDYYPAIRSVAVVSVEETAAAAGPGRRSAPADGGLATLFRERPRRAPVKRGSA